MHWRPPVSRTASDIQLRWTKLRNEPATTSPAAVAASNLGVDTGFGVALLSVSEAGEPRLLLPVAPGTHRPPLKDLPVLEIGAGHLSDSKGARPYLIVSCLSIDLNRPFADLVLSVLSRIEEGEAPSSALIAAIEDLRTLFAGTPVEKIEAERIQGLAAELLVLLRLVKKNIRAVELWSGPAEHRHDFRGGSHAIEVKSTRRQSGAVTISSIDQLDIPRDGTLDLWRLVLDRTQNGPVTIMGLVSEIEALTGPSSLLRDGLKTLGCPDPRADNWNAASFNVETMEAFSVADGFPRIVKGTFGSGGPPPGLARLTYGIDLAQAAAFALTPEEMSASEDRITACLK